MSEVVAAIVVGSLGAVVESVVAAVAAVLDAAWRLSMRQCVRQRSCSFLLRSLLPADPLDCSRLLAAAAAGVVVMRLRLLQLPPPLLTEDIQVDRRPFPPLAPCAESTFLAGEENTLLSPTV